MSVITKDKLANLLLSDIDRVMSALNVLKEGNFLLTAYIDDAKGDDTLTVKGEREANKIANKHLNLIKKATNLIVELNKALADPNPIRHMALHPNKRGMMTTIWGKEIDKLVKNVDKATRERMDWRAY